MAIYHVRNDGLGNNANSGTSEALAWATLDYARANLPAGVHTLKFKATGTNYVSSLPTGVLGNLFTNAVSAVIFSKFDSDTSNPKLEFRKDPANPTFSFATPLITTFLNCDVEQNNNSAATNTIVPPLNTPNTTGNYNRIIDSDFYFTNVATASGVRIWPGQANSGSYFSAINAEFISNGCSLTAGLQGGSNTIKNCKFYNWSTIGFSWTNLFITNCLFDINSTSTSNFGTPTVGSIFKDNTIFNRGNTTTGRNLFTMSAALQAAYITDNLFVDLSPTNPMAFFGAASSTTMTNDQLIGNNVYYGALYTRNLTTGVNELISGTKSLVGIPFISTTYGSPNFLKIDFTLSEVIAKIQGKNSTELYTNIGSETNYPSAGETDPTKVLTTSTVIAGQYIPVSNADVRFGVSVGLSQTGLIKVPATSDVRSGVNVDQSVGTCAVPSRNDVRLGVAVDDTTGLVIVPSRNDVRLGVETDNTVGLLDVEAEANLPLEENVLEDTGSYGPNLDKVPSYSPDFPDRANVAPDDTVNGQAGTMDLPSLDHVSPNDTLRGEQGTQDLPELESILETDSLEGNSGLLPTDKVAPSKGGTYLGEESNDPITSDILLKDVEVMNLGEVIIGDLVPATGISAIPPKKVEDGYVYTDSEGSKVGELGRVSENNIDISSQVVEKMKDLFKSALPAYAEMKYVIDPLKNDFYNNSKQIGIMVENSFDDKKLINGDVVNYSFKIVMSNDYVNLEDDSKAREAAQELINSMELIRRKVKVTRAGTYNTAGLLWEFEWNVDSPDFYESDKLVILQAYFTIKAKNTYI